MRSHHHAPQRSLVAVICGATAAAFGGATAAAALVSCFTASQATVYALALPGAMAAATFVTFSARRSARPITQ